MRKNKLDSIVQLLIPPSLIILLVVTIIELFYGLSKGLALFVDIFDIYVVVIFAIDLRFRWLETPKFWPYVKKHILDIIATIPFNLIFWGIQGLTLIKALRGVKFIARIAKLTRFAKYAKLIRLIRFGARAPRFLRLRKDVKKGKVRKVQPHEKQLKKTLSFKVILLITINSIMGTGIWFLTSAGAKHAGPASLISWAVLSLISIYIAMCFSELTAMFPKAGGVYEFAKQAYGRFMSFVVGWTTAIAGSVTIAMLLLGALQYLIPIKYSYLYVPIAITILFIFSIVAFRGMGTSTYVLVTFALITLTAVLAIIIPGFVNLDPANFEPFFVLPTLGIVLAIFFIAETFFGWESAIFLSAETKNPRKVMPKALIWGTVVIAILAFLLAFTAMGTIPWDQYAESAAPLRDLGAAHFGDVGRIIFTVLIFISVIGATAGWIVTAPRLLMSIAEDKLFFVQFSKIHPKRKSPYVSIAFQFFVVSILVFVGAGSYETLLHMLIPLIIIVYSAVLLAVMILRFKKPEIPRPYKVLGGKFGPIITILFMIFLLVMFIRETHGAFDILRVSGSLIAFGIPAYFFIELFYNPKYVTIRRNFNAKMRLLTHKIPRPRPIYQRVVKHVSPLNKKDIVVDYNSPIGGLSKVISLRKFKELHAVNISKEEIHQMKKHLPKKVKTHLVRLGNTPTSLKKVTVFISYDNLGYVRDLDKFLKKVSSMLRKNGKFCFYVTHHFLNVAPNIMVDDSRKIKKKLAEYGLKATYQRKKYFLKKDIFIYGKKK